jgi:p21-activated kinase 1
MEIMEISTPNTPSIRPADFLPSPTNRMGTTSRTLRGMVTLKDKKGVLGFMTDLLNSNKRPEITTPHDLVHLTHVRFDSSTRQYIGLPKGWQRLLHDSGISKSDQEKDPLAVVKIVEFYQDGGGGDIWDKMGRARAAGSSRSPPIPGMVQAAYPGPSKKSVNIPVAERRAPQPPTVPAEQGCSKLGEDRGCDSTATGKEERRQGK